MLQAPIADLAAAGQQTILIVTSDDERALRLVADHRAVESAEAGPDGVRVALQRDVEADVAAGDISRRLVLAGLVLNRFEPTRVSLEQRFLEITSRLEAVA